VARGVVRHEEQLPQRADHHRDQGTPRRARELPEEAQVLLWLPDKGEAQDNEATTSVMCVTAIFNYLRDCYRNERTKFMFKVYTTV